MADLLFIGDFDFFGTKQKEAHQAERYTKWIQRTRAIWPLSVWERRKIDFLADKLLSRRKPACVDVLIAEEKRTREYATIDISGSSCLTWDLNCFILGCCQVKPWPNGCNMLVQHCCRQLHVASVWPPCCTVLRSFGQPTQHVATWSNNVACNMLHPFGLGLKFWEVITVVLLWLETMKAMELWQNRQSCKDVRNTETVFSWFLMLPLPSWYATTTKQ